MLQITEVEMREISLPLKEPFRISSGVVQQRRILLLCVRDGDGCCGWGECVAGEFPNYSPEAVDLSWFAIGEWVIPRILNRRLQGARQVHALLEENFRGNRMSKAALEMAVWELEARRLEVSLAALLGGTREKIPVGISIGIQETPESLAVRAHEALCQGYRKLKIKIRPGADLEYIAPLVAQLGTGSLLMADANSAYTLDQTESLLRLDRLGLMMIEQPLAWDDLLRHARLQQRMQTPICLDESIPSLERARDMIALGSGRIINIKPGRVGGFSASIAIHDLCRDQGIPVWCGGMLESGIGRAHNVALASLENFQLPGDISPSCRYWERDIVCPEWTMDSDGMVTVPHRRPGMGVEVDLDRVENLTCRRQVYR